MEPAGPGISFWRLTRGRAFQRGQLLDASRYYVVLVDGVGHGKSSKPSDGMHAKFPQYDYDDMVVLHHKLLTDGLGVNHLRLIFGPRWDACIRGCGARRIPISWMR